MVERGIDLILLGFTGFYRVLPGFTEFYRRKGWGGTVVAPKRKKKIGRPVTNDFWQVTALSRRHQSFFSSRFFFLFKMFFFFCFSFLPLFLRFRLPQQPSPLASSFSFFLSFISFFFVCVFSFFYSFLCFGNVFVGPAGVSYRLE